MKMLDGAGDTPRQERPDMMPPELDTLTTTGLLALIDYTLLKPEETLESYTAFVEEAGRWGFRSVFVPSAHVPLAVGLLEACDVLVGAPVGFPFGYESTEAKVAEALSALEDGASELDVVMNVSLARSGCWDIVEEDLAAVVEVTREWGKLSMQHVVVKVILETPYLDEEQKVEACRRAVAAGIDYVKTATGLGPGGATVEDVSLMRGTVGPEVGVKAAGGIRTWEDARLMFEAGANRIGTSTGPAIVEGFIRASG